MAEMFRRHKIIITTSECGMLIYSVVFVCVSVCMSVCVSVIL